MEVESDDDYEEETDEEILERDTKKTARASAKKTGGIFSMFKYVQNFFFLFNCNQTDFSNIL